MLLLEQNITFHTVLWPIQFHRSFFRRSPTEALLFLIYFLFYYHSVEKLLSNILSSTRVCAALWDNYANNSLQLQVQLLWWAGNLTVTFLYLTDNEVVTCVADGFKFENINYYLSTEDPEHTYLDRAGRYREPMLFTWLEAVNVCRRRCMAPIAFGNQLKFDVFGRLMVQGELLCVLQFKIYI